jgi:aminodeoxyfutalosine deaminase
MRTVYFARWIYLADGSVLENGALAVEGSTITAIGGRAETRRDREDRTVNLGQTLLLPGLINLHTHLEEGCLRAVAPTEEESYASRFAKRISRLRQATPRAVESAIRLGIRELLTQGITSVLDTSRLGIAANVLGQEPMRAWVHHELHPRHGEPEEECLEELVNRMASAPTGVGTCIGPHALFSLSASGHRRLIRMAHDKGSLWACHVAESAEEVQAFAEQSGDLYFHITRRRAWPCGDNPTGPMYYALTNSLIPSGAICFHCNYVSGYDLGMLAAKQVSIVISPSHTETMNHKPFPVDLALKRGIRVCAATETVADSPSLSLFDELYRLRLRYPHIPAPQLLSWVTRNPAIALGMGGKLGILAPGRLADIVGVHLRHDPNKDVLEELLAEEPIVTFVMVDGEEIIVDS